MYAMYVALFALLLGVLHAQDGDNTIRNQTFEKGSDLNSRLENISSSPHLHDSLEDANSHRLVFFHAQPEHSGLLFFFSVISSTLLMCVYL
jgi:hypothetical protein